MAVSLWVEVGHEYMVTSPPGDVRNGSDLIDDRPQDGVFRVHRDAFRDPAVFELEMQRFFERGWVFVGHESQIPHPHDFVTVRIGRSPVIISPWRCA
jgi:benzoate/toluate 1,2-dioxygenase alpha subunit/2,4,5-trichlorophenoxyacetic acid oxygenase 1